MLSLVLNPPKGTTVLRIRDFSRRGARQVHEATLRNGHNLAPQLRQHLRAGAAHPARPSEDSQARRVALYTRPSFPRRCLPAS